MGIVDDGGDLELTIPKLRQRSFFPSLPDLFDNDSYWFSTRAKSPAERRASDVARIRDPHPGGVEAGCRRHIAP
jgi:hypothetical protein